MIPCEGQSNTGMCVATAKGVGDVLDSSRDSFPRRFVLHQQLRITFQGLDLKVDGEELDWRADCEELNKEEMTELKKWKSSWLKEDIGETKSFCKFYLTN